jgi:hypothetical protein
MGRYIAISGKVQWSSSRPPENAVNYARYACTVHMYQCIYELSMGRYMAISGGVQWSSSRPPENAVNYARYAYTVQMYQCIYELSMGRYIAISGGCAPPLKIRRCFM